jgi:hypothetical protein
MVLLITDGRFEWSMEGTRKQVESFQNSSSLKISCIPSKDATRGYAPPK